MKTITMTEVKAMDWKEVRALAVAIGVPAKGKRHELEAAIEAKLIADGREVEGRINVGIVDQFDGLRTDKMYRGLRYVNCPVDDCTDGRITYDFGRINYCCKSCDTVFSEDVFKKLVDAHLDTDDTTEDDFFNQNVDTELEPVVHEDAIEDADDEPITKPASEASRLSAPAEVVFTFIKATPMYVHFKQNGSDVFVGWSADGKSYIKSAKGKMLMSPSSMIAKFKRYDNNINGDVARIVKALVAIKRKPVADENVSRPHTKENAQRRRGGGTIDPIMLTKFKRWFESKHGRVPTGLEILRYKESVSKAQ